MKQALGTITLLSACFIALSCGAYNAAPHRTPGWRGLEGVLEATVQVHGARTGCAGFVYDTSRVVTAAHCVEPDSRASVRFYSRWHVGYAFRVAFHDDAHDVAVLVSVNDDTPPGVRTLPIARYVRNGARLIAVGHPSGLAYSTAEGIVAFPKRRFTSRAGHYVQTTIPVWYGMSGGPAINMMGQVVGVASFFMDSPSQSFFAHVDYIRAAIEATDQCR